MEKEESGVRRTVWLPKELDTKVEETRKLLGLGRSGFYRFCIVETLKGIIIAKQSVEVNKN